MSLGLVQGDTKTDVGCLGDGAGHEKVQRAHLVAKARFLRLNTIDILDQVTLCRGADLCIVGPLAASLSSATGCL